MSENQSKNNSQYQVIIPRFTKSSEVKVGDEAIDEYNVGDFIRIFNHSIKHKRFSLNNGLDKIPTLNDNEFKLAQKIAKEDGWCLTRIDDNYNTTSYKIEKIKQ